LRQAGDVVDEVGELTRIGVEDERRSKERSGEDHRAGSVHNRLRSDRRTYASRWCQRPGRGGDESGMEAAAMNQGRRVSVQRASSDGTGLEEGQPRHRPRRNGWGISEVYRSEWRHTIGLGADDHRRAEQLWKAYCPA